MISIRLLVTSNLVFSYEEKVVIKYRQIKRKYIAKRIVNDHPEYNSNVNGVNQLKKMIDKTGEITCKKRSGIT